MASRLGMKFLAFVIACCAYLAWGKSPTDSVLVFQKGEGGYYCHKIPYLFRTVSNVLIAMAEGRGRDGRTSCDDFSVIITFFILL